MNRLSRVMLMSMLLASVAGILLSASGCGRNEGHEVFVCSVAYSPDGRYYATGGGQDAGGGEFGHHPAKDCTVRLWDAIANKQLRRFDGHVGMVKCVVFSPDGFRLISASSDGTVRVWERETGNELRRLEGHKGRVNSVAVSPDGLRVLTGDGIIGSGSVRLWDLKTGAEIRRFDAPDRTVNGVAIAPNGRQAVSASEDGTLRVWDVDTGKELRCLKGHQPRRAIGVRCAAFSRDGRKVVSGGDDRTVRMWDAETGKQLWSVTAIEEVSGVAFAADGHHVVSSSLTNPVGGAQNSVELWDAETGSAVQAFRTNHPALCTAFSPDGSHILSGGWYGEIRQFTVPGGN